MLFTPGPEHQLFCYCITFVMQIAHCTCQYSCGLAGASGKEAGERHCQCVEERNSPFLHAPQTSNGTVQRSWLHIPVNSYKMNRSLNATVYCWAGEGQDKLMKLCLKLLCPAPILLFFTSLTGFIGIFFNTMSDLLFQKGVHLFSWRSDKLPVY